MRLIYFFMIGTVIFACAEKRSPFSLAVPTDENSSDPHDSYDTDSSSEPDSSSHPESTDSVPLNDSESISPTDSDSMSQVETDSHSDSESEPDSVDTGTTVDSETTTVVPGNLGDRCWIPVLSPSHPNAGLPDCASGLTCIGDSDEAWCTATCETTGDLSSTDGTAGWCCGEVGNPCAPTRYYMPLSMDINCAPRSLNLGEPCQAAGDSRCAPLCQDTEIIENSLCVQVQGGGFCSYPCTENADCTVRSAFANGCCGTAMGNTYCMPEGSDRCL